MNPKTVMMNAPLPEKSSLKKPKAILFDWDGTLVDSLGLILAGNNHVRDQFGLAPMTSTELLDAMRLGPALIMFKHLYPGREQEALDLYYAYMVKARAQTLLMATGAEDLMELLKQNNIPTGVVSNMKHGPLQDEIKRVGWDRYFKTMIGADASRRGKPHPDPILLGIEELGFDAHEDAPHIWYVGDMETDVLAAQSAGCNSVFIRPGEIEDGDIIADLVVGNCCEISAFLKRILTHA
jgi:phosphoglycolate phosphatase